MVLLQLAPYQCTACLLIPLLGCAERRVVAEAATVLVWVPAVLVAAVWAIATPRGWAVGSRHKVAMAGHAATGVWTLP